MAGKYRLVEGRLSHADGTYVEGDEFEASESTVRALGHRLEPVDGDGEDAPTPRKARSSDIDAETDAGEQSPSVDDDYETPAEADEDDDLPDAAGEDSDGDNDAEEGAESADEDEGDSDAEGLDYDELSISELEDVLEERDFSDDELDDLLDYEKEHKNRKGAIEAIEDQR